MTHLPMPARAALLAWALGAASQVLAAVTPAALFQDGAILQHGRPVTIHGRAREGERVTIHLDGEIAGSTIATGGRWRVTLPPRAPGGPHRLDIAGDNRLTIGDLYFGDLWLAGGQSNMELPLERVKYHYAREIARQGSAQPLIRQFSVARDQSFAGPRADIRAGRWIAPTDAQIGEFSAVAWFFARALQRQRDIPVGIVRVAVGGSRAESWMSEAALADFPDIAGQIRALRRPGHIEGLQQAIQQREDNWRQALDTADLGLRAEPPWYAPGHDDSHWPEVPVPGLWDARGPGALPGAVWLRREVELKAGETGSPALLWLGTLIDADETWVNGERVGGTGYRYPPRRYELAPGTLRPGRNLIAVRLVSRDTSGGPIPDKPYVLRTAEREIDLRGPWRVRRGAAADPLPSPEYQDFLQPLGYYNAMLAPLAPLEMSGVIFYQGESNVGRAAQYRRLFPALIADWRALFGRADLPFLYVQLASYLPAPAQPAESAWAELRAAQAAVEEQVPHSGMAVTIDVGEWNDIHPVDKRAVGERLALLARRVAYGDEKGLVARGPRPRCMSRTGDSLRVHFRDVGGGLATRDGAAPDGFALAAGNSPFRWVRARLDGNSVVIAGVPESPLRLRYAWADNPARANLYNREGLPATPFENPGYCSAEASVD